MLIATQGKSVVGTQRYFEQVLTQGDYYLGQEVTGRWHGKGAELLGLGRGAQVTRAQFNDLLDGKHPTTGARLAQRSRKDRRPGMDLTFSVPKSVSLAWAINEDERVVDALREAVHETMACDVEPLMQRRVRSGKHARSKQKSTTGKLLYADFLHKTSRPVEGLADPHLHIHAFVVNWTEDDGTHYAGEFEEIVRQRPSLQAKFEARLARKLQEELGYGIESVRYRQSGKVKCGWEILGIARAMVEKFSRRTAQVEAFAAEHGIEDAEAKGRLGKQTREQKNAGKSVAELRAEWRERLTEEEYQAMQCLLQGDGQDVGRGTDEQDAALASVKYALAHHLYRESTVERHQVVGTALEHGLTLRPEMVERTIDSLDLIERSVDANGSLRQMMTTPEVLQAEREMIAAARDGRGTRKAIGSADYQCTRDWLNDHQQGAVRHVLESRDGVLAITGGAGTGKSSLMQEAAEAVRHYGKEVFAFAPSTGAKEVLEEKGFQNAQTVEHLIRNAKLHPQLKEQVVWIDEAGLLDVRSMNAIFKIAQQQNARVVLSGDTRQHASPRRGEAMRLLEKEAGLKIARAEKIQRQQGRYRKAVALISKGHEVVEQQTGKTGLLAGFDLLDSMGKIHEIAHEERHAQLAEAYLKSLKQGKAALIVAPTHAEAAAATAEIRTQLQQQGKLARDEQTVPQYRSLNLSEAEKGEVATYADQKDLVIQFHQNSQGGFKRGERYRVLKASSAGVEVVAVNGEQRKTLPLALPDRFEVYSQNELAIAAGDKIRFSLGGTTQNKQGRLSNGRLDEVKGFDKRGNLILKNGWVVDRNYAHIDLGYVVTSHASQGKDRPIAIAAMGSRSLPAIHAKQFYVTVSRGCEEVMIFVDDKAKVRRAIQRSGEQLSATALVQERPAGKEQVKRQGATHGHDRPARRGRRAFQDRVVAWWQSLRSQHKQRQAVGRHRASRTGHTMGLPPGMNRSYPQ